MPSKRNARKGGATESPVKSAAKTSAVVEIASQTIDSKTNSSTAIIAPFEVRCCATKDEVIMHYYFFVASNI